jgi:uncharacterized membrane protein YkgB
MSNQNLTPDHGLVPKPRWWQSRKGHYFIGIAAGSPPLILTLIALGFINNAGGWAANLLIAAGILYALACIATIAFLIVTSVRFIGYGLLTMVLAIPVIAFLGCIVIITWPH